MGQEKKEEFLRRKRSLGRWNKKVSTEKMQLNVILLFAYQ
jgi:hypothetical protein